MFHFRVLRTKQMLWMALVESGLARLLDSAIAISTYLLLSRMRLNAKGASLNAMRVNNNETPGMKV